MRETECGVSLTSLERRRCTYDNRKYLFIFYIHIILLLNISNYYRSSLICSFIAYSKKTK